jgi:hypothetical protein
MFLELLEGWEVQFLVTKKRKPDVNFSDLDKIQTLKMINKNSLDYVYFLIFFINILNNG